MLSVLFQFEEIERASQVDRERLAKSLMAFAQVLHRQHKTEPDEPFRSFTTVLPTELGQMECSVEIDAGNGAGSLEPRE
jgi:hypothetical protein